MKKFYLAILPLFVVACSTGPKVAEKSKKYATGTKIVSLEKLSTSSCNSVSFAKDKKWQTWIDYANACVKKENWKRVNEYGLLLSQKEANSPWGPYYQSLAAEKEGNFQKSLWMLDLALKKAPNLAILYYQKARIEWRLENFVAAVRNLETSVNFDPNNSQAHLLLGQIYFRDGQSSKASQHFHSVLILEPKNQVALFGVAEAKVDAGDFKGAVQTFDQLISYNKSNMDYWLRKAEIIEQHIGNKKLAMDLYKKILTGYRNGRLKGNPVIDLDNKIKELKRTLTVAKN